jgi:hypothetical protein
MATILFLLIAAGTVAAQPSWTLTAALKETEGGSGPRRGPVGRLPHIEVTVVNHADRTVTFTGPLGHPFEPGPRDAVIFTGPDGKERRFRAPPFRLSKKPPASIRRGETLAFDIPLSAFFAAPEPGPCSVRVTLFDRDGASRTTAPVRFEVFEPPASHRGLEVAIGNLDPEPNLPRLEATFTNHGRRPVTIIVPQDGSLWGWVEPHYWLETRDALGAVCRLVERCGVHGAHYDEKSLIRLGPGDRHTVKLYLPHALGGGRHTVTLHYIVTKRPASRRAGFGVEPGGALPATADDLFIGRVRSNTLSFVRPGPRWNIWRREPLPDIVDRLLSELTATEAVIRGVPRRKEAIDVLADLVQSKVLSTEQRRRIEAVLPQTVEALLRPIASRRGYSPQHHVALRTLVDLGILAPAEVDRIRSANVAYLDEGAADGGAKFAMQILARLADASCDGVFWESIDRNRRRGLDRAVEGLVKIHGRGALVRRLMQRLLDARPGARLRGTYLALAYATNQSDYDYFKDEKGVMHYPQGPADLARAHGRWLAWWEEHQDEWAEKPR